MRSPVTAGVLVVLAGCGPQALPGAPFSEGVTERRHDVAVHFEAGTVRLAVTRELFNETSEEQAFETQLELPEGAIVTALRLGRGAGPLLEAPLSTIERVTEDWTRLTGEGEAEPEPIGRLQWLWDGEVQLEVFAVPPHESVTVAYDVRVEPRYEAGVLVVEVPRGEGLPPRFERASVEETDDAFIVRRQHATQPVADVRWATAPLDTDRVLWRLELDAAPELEAPPRAPRFVFLIDASHSEGPGGIAAQLELIGPILANAPDATVEVVVVRRAAVRLFGAFLPAREVPRRLAAQADALGPGNGSHLDEGVRVAAQALAGGDGPARIIAFTDQFLRASFSTDAALEALRLAPPQTVLHLVGRSATHSGGLEERRDDEAELAPLAAARGGVFLNVTGRVRDERDAALTLRGLVRPVRIDGLRVEASGLEVELEAVLNEGQTVRVHGLGAQPPDFVTVTGMVWAQPFRRVVGVDAALAQRLPGLAIGTAALREQLEDDEVRSAAFLAQAVSPLTAYLAAPPHAAPSRVGGFGFGVGGVGTSSCGCGGAFTSLCGGRVRLPRVDLARTLRQQLAPGVAACAAQVGVPAAGHLTLETTLDEVVDVKVATTSSALAACVTEAAWALRLDEAFRHVVEARAWTVSLAPGDEVEPE